MWQTPKPSPSSTSQPSRPTRPASSTPPARHDLRTLRDAGGFLVGLLLLGLGLLALYLVRLRAELRDLPRAPAAPRPHTKPDTPAEGRPDGARRQRKLPTRRPGRAINDP